MLIARFRRHYPDPSLWRSPEYRTRDHVIPFGLFWIYQAAIPSNMALDRLSEMRAILGALGIAFGKKGTSLPESVRQDQKSAYLAE